MKKECKKLIAEKKNAASAPAPTSSNSTSGHLHNLKEDIFEDAVAEDTVAMLPESSSNDTNDDVLYYFSCMTNHYLRLVKVSPHLTATSRHNMRYPIIADSGANFHMFKEREFFDTLHPANGQVILGDGKTELSIKGVGTIKCKIGDHILTVLGVRYVPDLAESIYSLFLHIQCPHHGLHSSFEDGLYIVFPDFKTKASLGHDDIYLDAVPFTCNNICSNSIVPPAPTSSNNCQFTTDTFCRTVKHFDDEVTQECKSLDN
jgi:hypothetical protein